MEKNIKTYGGRLKGWKVYTPWGDVPNASGWFLDDEIGLKFLEQVSHLGNKYGANKVVACHKGFALPAFDQRSASPRDVGPAARAFPDVSFIVYHSGFDSEDQGPYPGDDLVNSADRGVNCFIKSLRENGIAASQRIQPGMAHGNTPNVYGEIGATWRSNMHNPDAASHLLGKLITHVGPKRICWGTDSLWWGTPQPEIVALRAFKMTDKAKALYHLPYGLEGDVDDPRRNAHSGSSYLSRHPHVHGWPTDGKAHPERSIRNAIFGRNAARVYRVDADAHFGKLSCDSVNKLRESYILDAGTERERAPYRSNTVYGFRDGASLMKDRASRPWAP
jgi:predicted TIM-barrel fold metal-dependent hydrolase